MQTDALIIGGGPAGLATAIAARQRGLDVAVIEHREPPIDKACGEGLLPEGVAALRQLGVELDANVAHPLGGLQFSDGDRNAQAAFVQGEAWGVRRTALHRMLIERAKDCGAELLWGAKVAAFSQNSAQTNRDEIRYKWLVGADGAHSAVRKHLGISLRPRGRARFGFRRHYQLAPWTNFVEVHWTKHSQLNLTPAGAGEICVSLLTADPKLRIGSALNFFPGVAERFRGAPVLSSDRGAVITGRQASAVFSGNSVLVGDAAGTVDAITGLGVGLAFQQAVALADGMARDDLAAYAAAHERMMRTPLMTSRLLLWMSASPLVRRKVIKLFSRRPRLFPDMLNAHTGEASHALRPAALANLTWRLLWG